MKNIFFTIIKRDLLIASKQGSSTFSVTIFFILTITLFPIAIGSSSEFLSKIAPGIIWVAALLANIISLDRIFQSDLEDGSLEFMLLSGVPASVLCMAKTIAHWLSTGFILTIISPILALLINLPTKLIPSLIITMLVGTPILSLIGTIGASLILGVQRGGTLVSILILPLYLPVLIFGVGGIKSNITDLVFFQNILFLLALLLFFLVISPISSSGALKLNME
ncbi:heme exporter protein CcmB [Alphaproteobacteria bacterium]|nr:heme exporter protein CcmB [Alphaproteobacteria bacterium]